MPGVAALSISLGLHVIIGILMTVSLSVPGPSSWLFSGSSEGRSSNEAESVDQQSDRGPDAIIVNEEVGADQEPTEPIHYAGNSARGEAEQPTAAIDQRGQTAADAELYGQLRDGQELDGHKTARLSVKFKPTTELIDLLIRQGSGFVIAENSDVTEALIMHGPCSAPTAWTPVGAAEAEKCSERRISLTAPDSLLKTLQASISGATGSSADAKPWTIYLYFSNRFDRQLLNAQTRALQNIPEQEWPKHKTYVDIRMENGAIVPVASLAEKP
jgi:hypothetical protein